MPSAFVFQPAKVNPDFARFPELVATVIAAPSTEFALAGTVPVNDPAVAFALYETTKTGVHWA